MMQCSTNQEVCGTFPVFVLDDESLLLVTPAIHILGQKLPGQCSDLHTLENHGDGRLNVNAPASLTQP